MRRYVMKDAGDSRASTIHFDEIAKNKIPFYLPDEGNQVDNKKSYRDLKISAEPGSATDGLL